MKIGCKNKEEIIQYLIDERKLQNVTICDLAESCHMWPNQVVQVLTPSKNPQLDSIVKIGNALGIGFSTDTCSNYNKTAEELIDLLAESRIFQGITTRELASRCGIPQASISNILSGKVMPRIATYLNMANALGVEFQMY